MAKGHTWELGNEIQPWMVQKVILPLVQRGYLSYSDLGLSGDVQNLVRHAGADDQAKLIYSQLNESWMHGWRGAAQGKTEADLAKLAMRMRQGEAGPQDFDAANPGNPMVTHTRVMAAIQRFQEDNGIKQFANSDYNIGGGRVGIRTLTALNPQVPSMDVQTLKGIIDKRDERAQLAVTANPETAANLSQLKFFYNWVPAKTLTALAFDGYSVGDPFTQQIAKAALNDRGNPWWKKNADRMSQLGHAPTLADINPQAYKSDGKGGIEVNPHPLASQTVASSSGGLLDNLGVVGDAIKGAARWTDATLAAPMEFAQGAMRDVVAGVANAPAGVQAINAGGLNDAIHPNVATAGTSAPSVGALTSQGFVDPSAQTRLGQALSNAMESSPLGIPLPTGNPRMGRGFFAQGLAQKQQTQSAQAALSVYGHAATPGRLLAAGANELVSPMGINIVEPGSVGNTVLSGLTDFAVNTYADPSNIALEGVGNARRAASVISATEHIQGLEKPGVINAVRRTFNATTAKQWLDSPTGGKVLDWAAKEKDFDTILRQVHDVPTALKLKDASTTDEVRTALMDVLGTTIRDRVYAPPTVNFGTALTHPFQSLGYSFHNFVDPVRLLGNTRPGPFIDVNDANQAVQQVDRTLRNVSTTFHPVSNVIEYDGRKMTATEAMARASEAGRPAMLDVAKKVMGNVKDALVERGIDEPTADGFVQMFDNAERMRGYMLNDFAQNWDPGWARLSGLRDPKTGDYLPLPTPAALVDLLQNSISLPNARELKRITSWAGKTPGLKNGIPQTLADHAMNWIYKPFALLRPATTLRIIGEEQIRIAADGYISFTNHPLRALAMVLGAPNRPGASGLANDIGKLTGGILEDNFAYSAFERALQSGDPTEFDRALNGGFAHIIDVGPSRKYAGKVPVSRIAQAGSEDLHPMYLDSWGERLYHYTQDPVWRYSATHSAEETRDWFLNGEGRQYLDFMRGSTTRLPAGRMSEDEFVAQWKKYDKLTSKAEKQSDPKDWTEAERAAYDSGDWKAFSKLRGYSDQEISDYQRWLELNGGPKPHSGAEWSGDPHATYQHLKSIDDPVLHTGAEVPLKPDGFDLANPQDAESYLNITRQMIDHITGGDEQLKRLLVSKNKILDNNGEEIPLFQLKGKGRKPVGLTPEARAVLKEKALQEIGPQVVWGDLHKVDPDRAHIMDDAMRHAFSALYERPTNRLSRSPYFRQRYWERTIELLPYTDQETAQKVIAQAERQGLFEENRADQLARLLHGEPGTPITMDKLREQAALAGSHNKVERLPEEGLLYRVDEGKPSTVDKPQGLYLAHSPEHGGVKAVQEFGTPTSAQVYELRPNAKVLDVPQHHVTTRGPGSGAEGITFPTSAGVSAAIEFNGQDAVDRMLHMPKADLVEELRQAHPEVAWDKFYDNYEMVEALAGVQARAKGYHALRLDDGTANAETAALSREAVKYRGKGATLDEARAAATTKVSPKLTAQEIDSLAKGHALDKTKNLLYDLTERSQFFDSLRLLFPFGEAWKEVTTRWAKIVRQNPRVIRRFDQIVTEGKRSGFFYTDPTSGEEVFNYPGSQGFNKLTTGIDVPITSQLNGLNVMGNGLPGVGWAVQIPMQFVMKSMPTVNDSPLGDLYRDYVAPYGDQPGNDPVGVAVEAALPGWMDRIREVMGNPATARQHANTIKNIERYLMSTGDYGKPGQGMTDEDMKRLRSDASEAARWLTITRAVGSFTLPAAPQFQWQMIDKDGKLAITAALNDELGRLRDKEAKGEIDDADAEFVRRHGLTALGAMTPMTQQMSEGLPHTEKQAEWVRANRGLQDSFPHIYGLFAPPDPKGNFDQRLYEEQVQQGERKPIDNEVWTRMANAAIAQQILDRETAQMEKQFPDGIPAQVRSGLAADRRSLEKEFPGFGDDPPYGRATALQKETELRKAIVDSRLKGTQQAKAMREYLTIRDNIAYDYDQQRGANMSNWDPLTTANGWLNAKSYSPVRLALKKDQMRIQKKYPESAPLFRYLFRNDVKE